MTVDPNVHAIATLYVDQLLVERNAYIEQAGMAFQLGIEIALTGLREQILAERVRPF